MSDAGSASLIKGVDYFGYQAKKDAGRFHGTNLGFPPEKLLALSGSMRGHKFPGSRRCDLFAALRLRRDATSNRERGDHRKASESKSAEVLAGVLARSGRDAHYSEATHKRRTHDGHQLVLLRRDCQRMVVQQLYGAEEVGLGQAMGLSRDDSSDLDSGVSEWGSGDDGETAAFEALLEEEVRRWKSPLSTPYTSCSSSDSPTPSLASWRVPHVRMNPVDVSKPVLRPGVCCDPRIVEAPVDAPSPKVQDCNLQTVPTTCVASSTVPEECRQASTVPSTDRRSEGVQCSGPPVDQGVQTSALRLPRKRCVRTQIIQARSPSECSVLLEATPECFEREVQPAVTIERVTVAGPSRHSTKSVKKPCDATTLEGAGARAGRMHVRIGFGGLQDADRGQEPALWAVAAGESANRIGPVIMLPFEGDGNQNSCSGDDAREPRYKRFLSVTEFTKGPDFTIVEKSTVDGPPAHDHGSQDGGLSYGTTSTNSGLEGDAEDEWRKGRLDPLWEGLGSLGERLAGVDNLFDQLEQEIDHDREVVESYQREASDEIEAAERELGEVWVRRAYHPVPGLGAPQVPLWRSRHDTAGASVLNHGRVLVELQHGSRGGGSVCAVGPSAEDAAIAAEEELREARLILNSIERELRDDGATTAFTLSLPAARNAETSGEAKKDGPEASRQPSSARRSSPRTLREAFAKGNPRNAPTPGHARAPRFGDDALLNKRVAQQPAARSAARPCATLGQRGPGGAERAASALRGKYARGVGTIVAHFPTAVAAARSKARSLAKERNNLGR